MARSGRKRKKPPVLDDVVDKATANAVPVLRDAIAQSVSRMDGNDVEALQAELASVTRSFAEQFVGGAIRDIEARLFEQLDERLREELPSMIEEVIRQHIEVRD